MTARSRMTVSRRFKGESNEVELRMSVRRVGLDVVRQNASNENCRTST